MFKGRAWVRRRYRCWVFLQNDDDNNADGTTLAEWIISPLDIQNPIMTHNHFRLRNTKQHSTDSMRMEVVPLMQKSSENWYVCWGEIYIWIIYDNKQTNIYTGAGVSEGYVFLIQLHKNFTECWAYKITKVTQDYKRESSNPALCNRHQQEIQRL